MKWSFLSHFSFDGGAWNHAALRVKKRALDKISSLSFIFEVKSDLENSYWTIQIVSGESSSCDAIIRVASRFLWPVDHIFFLALDIYQLYPPPPLWFFCMCSPQERIVWLVSNTCILPPGSLFSSNISIFPPTRVFHQSSTQQYCICVSYTSCWMLCVFLEQQGADSLLPFL
jgi:hypothetical protein